MEMQGGLLPAINERNNDNGSATTKDTKVTKKNNNSNISHG